MLLNESGSWPLASLGLRSPMTYGVGAWQRSNIVDGTIGTMVCCQWNGYNEAHRPSIHVDSLLQSRKSLIVRSVRERSMDLN